MGAPALRRARLTVVTGLLGAAVAISGCANDAAPAATPPGQDETVEAAVAPVPTPEATPEPELAAVTGERVPAAHWVNSSRLLSHREAATGSGDTVLPLVHAVGDWLDAHLTDLQAGGEGWLSEVADPALLAAATPADVGAVTDGLTSPDATVTSARYLLEGSYDAMAEWLEATVEVSRVDGTVARATMVFTPGDDGPVLVMFGPVTAGGAA